MNKLSFILYLENSLIPDLKESGRMATANDLEACVMFMTGAESVEFDKQTGSPIRLLEDQDKRLIDTLEWRNKSD
jgi:hypothetical protein